MCGQVFLSLIFLFHLSFPFLSSAFYDPLVNPPPSSSSNLDQNLEEGGGSGHPGILSQSQLLAALPSLTKPWIRSLFLLMPLKLGLDSIYPPAFAGLISCLALPSSLGFIGGKPNRALYFVGFSPEDDALIGLDPHTTQEHPSSARSPCMASTTIPPSRPVLVSASSLDPSLCLGFYFESGRELLDFLLDVERDKERDTFDPSRKKEKGSLAGKREQEAETSQDVAQSKRREPRGSQRGRKSVEQSAPPVDRKPQEIGGNIRFLFSIERNTPSLDLLDSYLALSESLDEQDTAGKRASEDDDFVFV